MLFGELQGANATPAKLLARELMKQYVARLSRMIEAGKACGELPDALETKSATTLFIGMIQGLVMQSLIAADMAQTRANAPHVFAIYRRGIETAQSANSDGEGVS